MSSLTPVEFFKEKAKAVSIVVAEVADKQSAYAYAINLCKEKERFNNLLPDGVSSTAVKSTPEGFTDADKIIAAPGLAPQDFAELKQAGEAAGFKVINSGLRSCLAGLDVSLTMANMGIAETATTVLDCSDEEVRLASMLCEDHVLVLPKSAIRQTSFEVQKEIEELQNKAPRFISFISGASRTADIERVLALGVHGPLELHVLLLDA